MYQQLENFDLVIWLSTAALFDRWKQEIVSRNCTLLKGIPLEGGDIVNVPFTVISSQKYNVLRWFKRLKTRAFGSR